MDYDNDDGFPGLYGGESGKRSNDSDYSDGDHDKPSKKDLLIGRRKDKKDSKKDRGYAALEGESSPEEETPTKSPSKSKKTKAFKFPSKSKEKRDKSRDKEKVNEKEVKEKEKEQLEKEKKKEKLKKEKEKKEKEKVKEKEKEEKIKLKVKEKEKDKVKDKDKEKKEKKSSKLQPTITAGIPFEEIFTLGVAQPIFGVPLGLAVERSRCHDESDLPLVVRHCIDHLQEFGLHSETVYRVEPPKQKVQTLRKLYNDREPVSERDYDVPTASFLLKQFLMELPEPVLTTELCSQFEDLAKKSPENLAQLISQLPTCHRALSGWLIAHLACLLNYEKANKLNVQTLGVLLGQVLNMSTHLLSVMITHCKSLFPNVNLAKYQPPLTSSAQLPEEADEIMSELKKQESLLNQIHAEMHAGFVTQKREEQLWEGQRIVTQLKRKLRSVQRSNEPHSLTQTQSSIEERQPTFDDDFNEKVPHFNQGGPSFTEKAAPTANTFSVNVTIEARPKQDKTTPESESSKVDLFPVGNFEDNFEDISEINMNDMTDSMYSSNSETIIVKDDKPKLSDEELALMRLELERAEYLQLKSILQAKINSEKFEIVKLKSQVTLRNKQECNAANNNNNNNNNIVQTHTEDDLEERQRLIKENYYLEQKRSLLINQIFQERMACVQLKIQIAMNEIQ